MAAFHLSVTFLYTDRSPASGLHARVHEQLGQDHDLGQTDDDGRVDGDIRDRRQIAVPADPLRPSAGQHQIDDPDDQPTFSITVSDGHGHSLRTLSFPYNAIGNLRIILPPIFWSDSASTIAEHSLRRIADSQAPGYVFMVRKNGVVWAEAPHGLARVAGPNHPALEMTNDTILHVATMSQPICAAAFVAMIEDWHAIQVAVAALAHTQPQESQSLTFTEVLQRRPVQLGTAQVPNVLAPLFASRPAAQDFVSQGFANVVPPGVRELLARFAAHEQVRVAPIPPIPPGHFGLLRRVMQGQGPPAFGDPFLPLIEAKLRATADGVHGAYQAGAGIAEITLHQLLAHASALPDGLTDPALQQLPGRPAAQSQEPADGSRAVFNLWPYLRLLLRQNALVFPGPGHALGPAPLNSKHDDCTVLGGVIEACLATPNGDTSYDDFAVQRLFWDARFNKVRRYVVDPGTGAWYYSGRPPFWAGGHPPPDHGGWPAGGGWYATARQMTDWLHALYTGQPVTGVAGRAPLVSANGRGLLFGSTGYFSPNGVDHLPQGVVGYRPGVGHGTGAGSSKLSVLVSPGATLHTAFFAANGDLPADAAFDAAVTDLINSGGWN